MKTASLAVAIAATVPLAGCHVPAARHVADVATTSTHHTTRSSAPSTLGTPSAAMPAGDPVTNVHGITLKPGSCHARVVNAAAGEVLPDPACTPGVTVNVPLATLCRKGYSGTQRLDTHWTNIEKFLGYNAYVGSKPSSTVEEDHLVSLELGGANDRGNLWPEPNWNGATGTNNPKEDVENHLHAAVCRASNPLPLAVARKAIAANWVALMAPAQNGVKPHSLRGDALDAAARKVAG